MKNKAFNKEIMAALRKYAAIADEKGRLQNEQLKLAYQYGWFKIFVPEKYNGLELGLPDALLLEEQLAFIDGSLGWTVTLCAGANLFVGYINRKTAAQIFGSQKVCFGGSGAATGKAIVTGDGFMVSGFWKYATGAPHLTHFTANCIIEKDGKPVLKKDNQPLIQSFFFKRNEVNIMEDWNTPGLKATAGHSFSVSHLKLPKERAFMIDAASATHTGPVFQFPFLQFAELTLAVNTLGMTRHFLKEAASVIKKRKQEKKITAKQYDYSDTFITNAGGSIEALREDFYEAVEAAWNELLAKKKIHTKKLHNISKLSARLVKECRAQVAAIYPYCGLSAVNGNTEIARIFRDIFTASQHSLLNYPDV
ncbi:acyl-CoA dehydrogenase family protein [Parafilimonas sp.]|uniref:acyl-CoA dehydrogenase family protein n=1 Tax=Parafilimonas sp. TaxID=1969739 RepID=UPI0039E72970